MVNVLPYTSPGNIISEGTGWVKKVEKCNNGSTTISVKLNVDGLIYHNIILKDVTEVDILNKLYSEPRKKRNVVTT